VKPPVAVTVFPGTNCEHDVVRALELCGAAPRLVWHTETDLGEARAVVVPGGFSFGDYLRTGAIARFSPVLGAVQDHVTAGGYVLGICNGFQILCEAGLLPGALAGNAGGRFLCRFTDVLVERTASPLLAAVPPGAVLRLPINHYEGRYVLPAARLAAVEAGGLVALRYVDNPNGSANAIAGVLNDTGNVLGLMPHPERAAESVLGSRDGRLLLGSLVQAAA